MELQGDNVLDMEKQIAAAFVMLRKQLAANVKSTSEMTAASK